MVHFLRLTSVLRRSLPTVKKHRKLSAVTKTNQVIDQLSAYLTLALLQKLPARSHLPSGIISRKPNISFHQNLLLDVAVGF